MSQKKALKKYGTVKIEPLDGAFFDIKPSSQKRITSLFGPRYYVDFLVVALIAILSLLFTSAYVEGKNLASESKELVYSGFEDLKSGAKRLIERDGEAARVAFELAEARFLELESATELLVNQVDELGQGDFYVSTAGALLDSALKVTSMGKHFADLIDDIEALPSIFLQSEEGRFIELLYEKKSSLDQIKSQAIELQKNLTTVNVSLLPESLELQLAQAQEQMGDFLSALLQVDDYFELLFTLLGDQVPHRYLILFQNNHEIRATGGFIGSYMLLELNDGRIDKMETKDVYQSDGQLSAVIQAPPGIDQVADRLYMRDANYDPDFPSAAQELSWFLEESRGPSVDTVIAIDQTVVERLLEILPPVRFPSVPFQVRADNFNDLMSFYTEAKLSDSITPKQLLFDFIPVFKNELKEIDDFKVFFNTLSELVDSGHIQAYSKESQAQQFFKQIGLTGELPDLDGSTDYFSVVSTSVGGNKSDAYIESVYEHQTYIDEDGRIENQLTIQKAHTWGEKELAKFEALIDRYGTGELAKETLLFIMGEGPNKDYMRVYVPAGAMLLSTEGIDMQLVNQEKVGDYEVFAFDYPLISPGESAQVTLSYELPFKLKNNEPNHYRFIAQKQAGLENVQLKKSLNLSEGLNLIESYPVSTEPFSLLPFIDKSFEKTFIFLAEISS